MCSGNSLSLNMCVRWAVGCMSPRTVWGIQKPSKHHFCEEFMQPWMCQADNWITFIHLWSGTGVVHDRALRHLLLYNRTASIAAKCSSVFKLTLQAWTPPTTCLWPKYESVNGADFSEGPYKNQLSLLCILAVAAVTSLLLSANSRTWKWMLCLCKDNS